MSAGWLALVLGASALAACNADHEPSTAAGPAAPTPPAAPSGPAAPSAPAADLPDGQRCLPVNVCDQWSGCGLVVPAPKFWKVIAAAWWLTRGTEDVCGSSR